MLGPAVTMCFGVCTYALYVGSLWYYEVSGQQIFPLVGGAVVGIGAGAVFITSGYIQVAYSDEKNKGKFIAIQNTLQATGSTICSILPVILNKDNMSRSGVPPAIYITYITSMLVVAMLALLTLWRPAQVKAAGVSSTAHHQLQCDLLRELKANLSVFKEWKLLLMLPAFLPAGSFLIYLGSVNAFQNSLRARSLLSFVALVVQVPFGHLLHMILDKPDWTKRARSLAGVTFVGLPLCIAWVWEIARTRNIDRTTPPSVPLDWADHEYGASMVLFTLNWTASILWQYIVPWFIGALDIPPGKLSHYMGVQRGFLAAGEAICFGVDAARISYVVFSGAIFAFYAAGIAVLFYIGAYELKEIDSHGLIATRRPPTDLEAEGSNQVEKERTGI
ncbi:hypothetical protein JX266_005498 [Neoarthrinium moseri]|nr:hypothetical protein JX266_005498 [Neoarthrinium moseri]